MKKTLSENLDKNFIRISNSPVATQVFFVKNPVEACVFVLITGVLTASRKNKIKHLPLVYETFRNIGKTKWYIKFDVKMGFHKIKITEKDDWMTTFKTKYGLFEWFVIRFGLANVFNIF